MEHLGLIWKLEQDLAPPCEISKLFSQQFAMKDGVAVAMGYMKIAERSIDE